MDDHAGLIQTIAILSACVVFLAKEGFSMLRSKNGKTDPKVPKDCAECIRRIEDLYSWHQPVPDPDTGQPRFRWYENTKELKDEMSALRKSMNELQLAMRRVAEALELSPGKTT